MRHFWADRRFIAVPAILSLGIWVQSAYGQAKGAPPSGGSAAGGSPGMGNTGNTPSPTRGVGTFGNIPNGSIGSNSPTMQRPIPLSGRVMFDDGTPANHEIRIERVCGGNPHFEAYTDSKGRFSFELNYNPLAAVDLDAADSTSGNMIPGMPPNAGPSGLGGAVSRSNPYWNCELRASYPGYRSDVVELENRRSLDDPDVGTIVLHRLANVKGSTISLTTALAPKHAQKDYKKGVELADKGKFEEAEQHLQKATGEYEKFAEAWFALGVVEAKQNKLDEARKSFQAAISADSKYVSPYEQLALLEGEQGKWQESANYSKQAIDLNPVEFPSAFWYNAVANYNLKKIDDAQKSALDLAKLDTRHHFPQVEHLLAQIYIDKAKYSEAATHLRTYLQLVPNAKNADALKQNLLKLEQARADAKK